MMGRSNGSGARSGMSDTLDFAIDATHVDMILWW